jgi:hypothetical protein
MKGIRYFLRNFTARAVKEHLRSQIERGGSGAELTPNEVELVRFAADRSDQLKELCRQVAGQLGGADPKQQSASYSDQ